MFHSHGETLLLSHNIDSGGGCKVGDISTVIHRIPTFYNVFAPGPIFLSMVVWIGQNLLIFISILLLIGWSCRCDFFTSKLLGKENFNAGSCGCVWCKIRHRILQTVGTIIFRKWRFVNFEHIYSPECSTYDLVIDC